jgi:hypothetical protein
MFCERSCRFLISAIVDELEISGAHSVGPLPVGFDVEADALAFLKSGEARDGADVNKNIVAAIVGLDEAKATIAHVKDNCSCSHNSLD